MLLYNGVLFALAVVVYMTSAFVIQQGEQLGFPFVIAFCSVYLAGLASLTVVYAIRKSQGDQFGVMTVLAGTLARTFIVAAAIILVIVTQEKKVAFFMLCFSIVFYFCLIPLNVWLTTLPKDKKLGPRDNHHETR